MALANAVSFNAQSGGTGSFVLASSRSSFLTLAQGVALGELSDGLPYSYLAQDSLSSPTQREWGSGVFTAATNTLSRPTVFGWVDSNSNTTGTGTPINFSTPPVVSLTVLSEDVVTPPPPLAGSNLTYYVATTGSDSNTGTSPGAPFLTIQFAVNTACGFNYEGIFHPIINVGAGTFNISISLTLPEIPGLPVFSRGRIIGAGVGVTTIFDVNSQGGIQALGPLAHWGVSEMTVDSGRFCFYASGGAFISHNFGNIGLTDSLHQGTEFYNAFDGGEINFNLSTITVTDTAFSTYFLGGGTSSLPVFTGGFFHLTLPSNVFTIVSGTYVPATGVITLNMGAGTGIKTGTTVTLAALTGSGPGLAALNGPWTAIAPSTGVNATLTLQGPITANAATITGGTATGNYGVDEFFGTKGNGQCIIGWVPSSITNAANYSGSPGHFSGSQAPIIISTGDGTFNSIPGNQALLQVDNFVTISGGAIQPTTMFNTKAGLPLATDISDGGCGVWKDTSGGGVYLACNDGGSIKKVALT